VNTAPAREGTAAGDKREPNPLSRDAHNDEITLGVLAAVEADARISQRTLSAELGVALGLANAYLKRCVRKGYIKIQHVPSRRYAYYLTPQGFAEKTRLTAAYLTSSLQFFRRARTELAEIMAQCAARGHRRIALAGASELAEIATLTAHDYEVVIVGIIDAGLGRARFCGLPVSATLAAIMPVDAVIVTRMQASDGEEALLAGELGEGRLFTPRLVKLQHIKQSARRERRNSAEAGESRSGE
jgi:DNA-binding MarR family transcriptional regulator